jgi:outer membrane receptor protein involved in Fe transport
MSIHNPIRVAIRRSLLLAAATSVTALGALPAMAQEQAGVAAAEDELVEVVVTGTRIKTPGLTANSPISTVSAEEIARSQPVAVEEFFKTLPAAIPAIGSGTNNGSNGRASIDLRGLGSNRNIVLVDGRRMVPADLDGRTDTNAIPLALIERVDLITGGASAVYGADAVTGVVNFILKDDFEGVELGANYGQSGDSDAARQNYDITLGSNLADGRGNVVLSLGYTKVDELRQGERALGEFSLSSTTGAVQGSGTATPVVINNLVPGQINTTTGAIVPIYNTYNFQPQNFYQTGLDRYQATALARFDVNDYAEVYANLFYTRSDVLSNIAASGSFLNNYSVPIGNPYLPNAARQQLCAAAMIAAAQCVAGPAGTPEVVLSLGRRFEELGPRINNFENQQFQYTIGVRGDITDTWSYDAYWSRGEAEQIQTRDNWGSLSKVQQALRAFNTTTCTNTANGCVPLNIFGPLGSINQQMLNFINLDALLRASTEQDVASASVSGDLGAFRSPFAELPIGVAVGAEYRRVGAANKSDSASQIQGEVLGTGAPTPDRSGTVTLKELFGEALIPILGDKAFAHALNIEVGYRQTEFSVTGGGSDDYGSYKYGLEWAPIESLRFRAMKQRATRSPNINELFQPITSGLSNLAVDPCQGTLINQAQANTAGTLSNLCRQTGVPLASIGTLPPPSAGQINVRTGGNPNLGPEKADTTTIGFVWNPSFVSDLVFTFDYYDIEITEAISSPTATDVLTDCYSASRNPGLTFNTACSAVLRDPVTGTFNGATAPGVVLPQSNVGYYQTSGYDLGVTWGYAFANERLGRLRVSLNGNYTDEWFFQATPNAVLRDCLGFYSVACDTATSLLSGPRPEFRWNQATTWFFGNFDVGYNWRHIDGLKEEPGGAVFLPAFSTIPSYDYVDLSAGWNVTEKIRLSLTVLNVTEEEPPNVGQTIGGTGNNSGNTYPQSYDTIGRYFTLGVNVKF